MKKAGIIALLIVIFAGAGFFWWNQGSAERAEEKIELAVKYVSENDFEKAILAYNDAIKIDPKATDAYQGLAKIYTVQGDYEKAQSVYEQGLAAVSAEAQPVLQLGLAGMYIDKGDMDQAEKSFRNLIQKDSSYLEAYWGLAMLYQQQGNNEQAETTLQQAIDNNPDQYQAYNSLALYLSQYGQYDLAFEQLVESLSLEVNQQEAYLVLTNLYQSNWDLLLEKLAGINDQKTAAMLEFYSYYAAEEYESAVNVFESKLDEQKDNHKARILAAIAMAKIGQTSEGQSLIAQLADKEVDTWLLSDIAEFYLAAGDKQKARYTAINALGAHSTNLEAVALLQRLNMDDEAGKIYAAQYMLYNWKPVREAAEELKSRALSIDFIEQPEGGTQQNELQQLSKEEKRKLNNISGDSSEFPTGEVVFKDPALEKAIREAINKPTGEITKEDVKNVRELKLEEKGIKDISGLENLTSLTDLNLYYNQISDISPLQNLTNLTYLDMRCNQISDISLLQNLTNLTYLNMRLNQISDISPLQNLTNLDTLVLEKNQISDISPLRNLTNLTFGFRR